jgi:hypothetical protein
VDASSSWLLLSQSGGGFNLTKPEFKLAGNAALVSQGSILSTRTGIRWWREDAGGDDPRSSDPATKDGLTRIRGDGGVQAWMNDSKSADPKPTWIHADNFEYAADRRDVLQFQGGPLRFSRQGVIMEAAEEWQFVRLFAGMRIVLSPGSWNVLESVQSAHAGDD